MLKKIVVEVKWKHSMNCNIDLEWNEDTTKKHGDVKQNEEANVGFSGFYFSSLRDY